MFLVFYGNCKIRQAAFRLAAVSCSGWLQTFTKWLQSSAGCGSGHGGQADIGVILGLGRGGRAAIHRKKTCSFEHNAVQKCSYHVEIGSKSAAVVKM